jgi:prepilin-type N-terminal cleavage/methylation domain-containing protein
MLKNLKKRTEGFTIVEVMIVLAIAGLIMLIIFLAVPALQRNSRNTQRKNDAAHLSGLINEYLQNNNGSLPTGIGAAATVGNLDLSNENFSIYGKPVTADIITGVGTLGDLNGMKINKTATCNNNVATSGGGTRAYTVTYQVEAGGGSTPQQCV